MTESMKALQTAIGTDADGEAGPNTAAALSAALLRQGFTAECWGQGTVVLANVTAYVPPPPKAAEDATGGDWMAEARAVLGKHERLHNDDLAAFLRSDGHYLGDPSEFPWCGDFVDTCLRLAGVKTDLNNPYLARNWMKFGTPVPPRFGAVMVFWRGKRAGPYGHVGFYIGEDAEHFHILGGNQGNSVSVSKIAKSRLLGARWPEGAASPARFRIEPGSTTVNEE